MKYTTRDWECALMLACEFIRKYPCSEMEAYFNNDFNDLLVGGAHDKQRSVEWALRFLEMAKNNVKIK